MLISQTRHKTLKGTFSPLRRSYFVLAIVSLVCGIGIYIFFRDSELLVWSIFPKQKFWDIWKIPVNTKGGLSVLLGFLPDCLWLLSGIFSLRCLWFFELKTQALYILVFYIIAAGYNIGQFYGIVPGTFDLFDLLTMLSVALTEGIIFSFFIKRRIQNDEEKF
ncbi:MAG: hypothetical protein FWC12_12120 [Treponema sp.]|nr:hypothetical protein [Treponema sp.]